jgi:molybdopterin-guanine dinucleotide biosynthesis protein A
MTEATTGGPVAAGGPAASGGGGVGRAAYDAVILAGGRGARLGGRDKGALVVRGRSLLDTALAAAAGARRIVVVGEAPMPAGVVRTIEEPRYAGPAAAVVAGLTALQAPPDGAASMAPAPLVLLLACDLPGAVGAVRTLLSGCDPSAPVDGWCLTEPPSRMQWLLGIYRTAALRRAVEALGDPVNRSMGRLLGPLSIVGLPAPDGLTGDIDTPDDLARWDLT